MGDVIPLNHNLITGKISRVTRRQQRTEAKRTLEEKQFRGQCDNECAWTEDFGWAPEAGCPVHD